MDELIFDNERLRHENNDVKTQNMRADLIMQSLPPAVKETAIWIRDDLPWWLNSRRLNGRQKVYIPVFAIRSLTNTNKQTNNGYTALEDGLFVN